MPVDPKQVQAVFLVAVECADPSERAAVLERQCGDDAPLRGRVEALLKAHDEPDELPQAQLARAGATVDHSPAYPPGTIIAGRYKLLEEIGEGGMGTVWVAQQTEPIRRRVALKLIKPGMDSRQVLSRFEAERQALALMDHPNIARVLDGGVTDQGRPFFVMEYVKGVPITDYCDQARLTLQARLKLFVQICQAVQHAHQKGIIHRDLKPSNVLVCLYDGQPVPKVIDFGLAKAIHQPLTEHTLYTAHGLMLGTPRYMSPEQAEFNNLDIDTRSDVYSLGVILYELLTGTTPLEKQRFKDAAWQEILRLIKEEEATRPSTKLSGSGSLPSIAAQRSLEPAQLSRAMRGDLDWIVMKSLEKERSRRYETANALARDVERYLHDEPVEARSPSTTYRFRKFARRNRVALTTAVLISAVLVLGTVVSTWQAVRATRAERGAEAARAAEAEQLKIAEQERTEAEKQREQSDANFQKARAAVDDFFTLVSQSTLFDVPGSQHLRMELLDAAVRYYREMAQQHGDDPSVLAGLAVAHLRLAEIYVELGTNNETVAAYSAALPVVEQLRREHPRAIEQHRKLAGFWKGNRRVQNQSPLPTDVPAAYRTLKSLADIWEQLAQENPTVVAFQNDLASLYQKLGVVQSTQRVHEEAIGFCKKAVSIWHKLSGDYPSEPRYREALATGYHQLLLALEGAGRLPEAEEATTKALALREELAAAFPDMSPYRIDLAESLRIRGNQMARNGQLEEAEKAYRRAVELCQDLVDQFPSALLYREGRLLAQYPLMKLLESTGQVSVQQAEQNFLQAIEAVVQLTKDFPTFNSSRYFFAFGYRDFGLFLRNHGRPPDAIVERLEELVRSDEPKSIQHPLNKLVLAMAHHRLGHAREAESCLGEGVEWIEKNGGEKLQEGAILTEPLPLPLRGQLQLLRREAEELLKKPTE